MAEWRIRSVARATSAAVSRACSSASPAVRFTSTPWSRTDIACATWSRMTRVMSLPALVNELILLVKASSLVSVVGILEVTRASQAQAATTFRPLEVYLAAACIYLLINLCLAGLGRYLEHRMAV